MIITYFYFEYKIGNCHLIVGVEIKAISDSDQNTIIPFLRNEFA